MEHIYNSRQEDQEFKAMFNYILSSKAILSYMKPYLKKNFF